MLHAAAAGDCPEAVPLLVAAGASVTLAAVNAAIAQGSVEVLAALLAAAPPPPVPPDALSDVYWLGEDVACPLLHVLRHISLIGPRRSARMVELLQAAGYRPTTYPEGVGVTEGDVIYSVCSSTDWWWCMPD